MLAILAEKPSAMRNMEKAFGGHAGVFHGEAYELCCARGHLYEFQDPQNQVPVELSARYRSWDLSGMPWDPADFEWSYIKKPDTSSVLKVIRDTFSKCDEIVIATDDDPSGEGTLLAAEIIIGLKFDHSRKISRMFFADESPKELQKAFVNRKRFSSIYEDPDYRKALYRSRWDLLSMQFTRIATKCGDGRSVLRQGRLKSAMVLLTGDQLAKVAAYKKIPFYQWRFRDENGNVFADPEEPQVPDRGQLQEGKYGRSAVVPGQMTRKKTAPPKPIDLASLSARLSVRGFRAKEVLDVYQKMYEAQVVSYPRTEDRGVTPEQFRELLPLCGRIAQAVGVDPALLTHLQPRPGFVKEGMAHGANRPGPRVPGSLAELDVFGKCARDIYDILARSYLAMLCEDFEYDSQEARLEKYPSFRCRISIPRVQGWKAVYHDDEDEEESTGFGREAEPFVHTGYPPKPQAPTMKWLMNQLDRAGVGTGATRTSTYAEVTSERAKYPLMKDSRGKISMTQYGEMSYRLLPGTHIGTLEITEHVFSDMKEIAAGRKDPEVCLQEVAGFVRDDMETMRRNGEKMRKELQIMPEENSERFEGVWNGEKVHPKRTWSGHFFTDDEVERLLNGEEIEIEAVSSKSGKPFRCAGKLEKQSYSGRDFVGFSRTRFVDSRPEGPDGWCRYQFTEKEKKDLLAGKTVKGSKFVAKSGKNFKAEVKWNAAEKKIELVQFL